MRSLPLKKNRRLMKPSQGNSFLINLDKEKCLAALPQLFFFFNLIRMTEGLFVTYYAFLVLAGGLGFLIMLYPGVSKYGSLKCFAVVYFIMMLANVVMIGNVGIKDIIANLLLFGVSVTMLQYKWVVWQTAVLFYITFVTLSYHAVRSPEMMLSISSNNYVSVLLIISVSLYYISIENNGIALKIRNITPAFLTFLLCVIAKGRGGILAGALLLAGIVTVYLMQKENSKGHKILIILAGISLLLSIYLFSDFNIKEWFFSLGNWKDKGAYSSDRIKIWTSYIRNCIDSPYNLFFGAPKKDIVAMAKYGGNPHNSFIQLHANTGIITLIYALVLIGISAHDYIEKDRYIGALLLGVICLRGFTDTFIFGNYAMPLFLYLVFLPHVNYDVYRKTG